jgi:DNA-binding transcriptional regulator PaaX
MEKRNHTNLNFGSVVLSKTVPFTLKELQDDLNNLGMQAEEPLIRVALRRLRDNGIVVEHGSTYSLVI